MRLATSFATLHAKGFYVSPLREPEFQGQTRAMKWALSLLFWVVFANSLASEPLRVFAAASLKGPLDQAVRAYSEQTGIEVRVSYAASSLLARQIAQGARADVFWSANRAWMDYLALQEIVAVPREVLGNSIVLAGAEISGDPVPAVCDRARIVTARTDAVPLGQYAKEALDALDLWPLPKGCLVETDNARLALVSVARGEIAAGILYASDVRQTGLTIWQELPTPAPIIYPLASVRDEGAALVDFLSSPAGLAPFWQAGFVPTKEADNG